MKWKKRVRPRLSESKKRILKKVLPENVLLFNIRLLMDFFISISR